MGWNCLADEDAIAIDSLSSDAVETLGDVEAFEFYDGAATRRDFERLAAIAENILRKLVTVTFDAELDHLSHQAGLEEGYDAVTVGVVVPRPVHPLVRGVRST